MAALGAIIYRGPSAINGAPIVAILTYRSGNGKTGDIPQLWILVDGEEPYHAVKTGADVAICGGCRHAREGTCYVLAFRAPREVYKSYKAGKYIDATGKNRAWRGRYVGRWFKRHQPRAIRLGAYGDPVAIPFKAISWFLDMVRSHDAAILGYTHQWRSPAALPWQGTVMASVDTPTEAATAQRRGWRTFRVRLPEEENTADEVTCPALTEGMTCRACRACTGNADSHRPNVAVPIHGAAYKIKRYTKARSRA